MLLVALAAATAVGSISCGAEKLDAPAERPEPVHDCIPPSELAPAFFEALRADRYAGLRSMVEDVLAACTSGGQIVPCNHPGAEPPVAGILLAGLFMALGDFAGDAPEAAALGTLPGSPGYCLGPGEEPDQPNRLCTITRSIDRMIVTRRDDGGIVLVEALDHLRPLLADLLRYVDGSLAGFSSDRYDDLSVFRRMVHRCDERDTIALLSAILDLVRPPRGQELLDDVVALLRNEDFAAFLASVEVDDDVGRRGMIALARILMDQLVRDDFHPDEMEATLEELVYPFVRSVFPDNALESDMRRAIEHIAVALDPGREPEILGPLKKTAACALISDPDERLMHAAYDLLFKAPLIGIDELLRTVAALLDIDPDGAILDAGDLILTTLAAMRDVSDAAKVLLRVVLDEPNARVLFPAAIDLLESDILSEMIALADQLLTACGGAATDPP